MSKYKNPREQLELEEQAEVELENQMLEEPTVSAEEERWKQRYGDLRRLQMERDAQHKAELDELKRNLETIKNQSMKPPKSEEEIAAWQSTYPEFAEILDTIVSRKLERRLEVENKKYKELEQTQEEIKRDKALMALKKAHPDCEETFADPKFHEWLKTQPQEHQKYIYKSFNVANASLVLDSWKLRKGAKSGDDGPNPKDAAKSIKTRTAASPEEHGDYWFKESQIASANDSWWEANEEKVYEAQRKGKILMDVSGGAR